MEQEKNNTKKRKWQQISEKERYKIEALFEQGLTPAQISFLSYLFTLTFSLETAI